jgi:hypothetical protein
MPVHGWGITEWARRDYRSDRIGWHLHHLERTHTLQEGEHVIAGAELEAAARPYREVIQRFVREQLEEGDTPDGGGA